MRHLSCVFTDSAHQLVAVAAVTDLGEGRFNLAVVTTAGAARCEPGNWTAEQAQEQAETWAEELLGGAKVVNGVTLRPAIPSRWIDGWAEP
jgi:hypothetical protein